MILYERWDRGLIGIRGRRERLWGFDWDTESVFMAFRDITLTEVNVSSINLPLYINGLYEHWLNGELVSQPGKGCLLT